MLSLNINYDTTAEWLSSYFKKAHNHDELANHCGLDSEHWNTLFNSLCNLSADEMNSRAIEINQLLQNGNIKHESNEQCQFDPLPFMFSPNEWRLIEAGVKQRAELLNIIQHDIYGGQQLLINGAIPAQQLYQNKHYLREGFSLPSNELTLFFTAVDIYRTPNGEFKVLADHCQSPLGLGLLLKSRIIARRVMAEEFAECNVQQIKKFLNVFHETINEYTHYMDDPRIVILTQGIEDPNYNEHAFLSTYLGFTLVQSADLTVRNGEVCLKSLQGLGKVNVILSWLPDNCIDSLEQTEYSLHGIPGLLQAVREEKVKVLNPFGSGVLSSLAVQCNLAKLSQDLLNTPLLLEQRSYYDVTDAASLDIATLELMSYQDANFKLDGALENEAIQLAIKESPEQYYFQDKAVFSSAPFWDGDQLIAKPVVFRCYALITENNVEVLPCALCFSSDMSDYPNISGWVKDTWILDQRTKDTVDPIAPIPVRKRMDVTLLEGVISSRTAEHLFWLGRYLERSENTIRILRVFIERYTELSIYSDIMRQTIAARLYTAIYNQQIVYPYVEQEFVLQECTPTQAKEMASKLLADEQCAGSIVNTLKYLSDAAVQIQELLSYDSRRIIDAIIDQINALKMTTANTSSRTLQSSVDKVIGAIMAFNGSIADCMPNSNGWFLLEMGRRVERSLQINSLSAALLTDELEQSAEIGLLESVLTCQVSLVTHKRRYRMHQSIGTGLELLLLDAEYPRSLLYQLEQISLLCQHLPTKRRSGVIAAHEKAILLSKTSCYVTERDYLQKSTETKRHQLLEFTHHIRSNLDTFCDVLLLQYFSHTQKATKLNWTNIEQAQS